MTTRTRYATIGIIAIFSLLTLMAGFILYHSGMHLFSCFGAFAIFGVMILPKFLRIEASEWLPICLPLMSFVAILVCIPISALTLKSYISYVASFAITMTVLLLSFQFRDKRLSWLGRSLLLFFVIYFAPFMFLKEQEFSCGNIFFYWGIFSAIFLGFLASLIMLIGSTYDQTESKKIDINQILSAATLPGFIVALFVLFLSRNGGQPVLVEEILPIASWVVPILSHYYGISFALGWTDQHEPRNRNFSLLFLGFILSFLLGFVFGTFSFEFPATINNVVHPYHYPLMWSSWVLITSYFLLLDTAAWNPSECFERVKKWITG